MSDNHGNTPAAWTTVGVVLLGFLVGSIGLMVYSWATFWVGVALVPVGVVAGIVVAKAGHGSAPRPRMHSPEEAREARRQAREATSK